MSHTDVGLVVTHLSLFWAMCACGGGDSFLANLCMWWWRFVTLCTMCAFGGHRSVTLHITFARTGMDLPPVERHVLSVMAGS
jgi:hypothetical protein